MFTTNMFSENSTSQTPKLLRTGSTADDGTSCQAKSKARRNLFGVRPVDRPVTDKFLETKLAECRENDATRFLEKWDFDVLRETPGSNSLYAWDRLSATEAPRFYTKCRRPSYPQENVPQNGQNTSPPDTPRKMFPFQTSDLTFPAVVSSCDESSTKTAGRNQQRTTVLAQGGVAVFDETPPSATGVQMMGANTATPSLVTKRSFSSTIAQQTSVADFFPQAKKQLLFSKERRRSDTVVLAARRKNAQKNHSTL